MVIQYICDACGKVTPRNYVSKKLAGELYYGSHGGFLLEIDVGVENRWNVGEICRDCLKELVDKLFKGEGRDI